ncbi:MAG: quinohemoprotein amine dehydrogenase subunit alpha [Proteobacteria bacterium]|nr:quinohemoprotein amine dehydrogenase subunit alpha [Pseudomonadota bacterium]
MFARLSLVCCLLICTSAAGAEGVEILRNNCGGCHQQSTPGHFARISDIRKSPEGWLMTIFRMQHVHHVQITEADRDVLIRYLSDIRGLAPSETTPARYALEQRPNVTDMTLPGDLQVMCARCHSAARVALQRRDAGDWLKHVHWHLAQWPTIEYQQNARDRLWWQKATTEVPEQLGKLYPLSTAAWDQWRARPHADLSGTWLVVGHEPGAGDSWGTATISKAGEAQYSVTYSLETAKGHLAGDSKAIVYTGFEWRGTASLAGRDIREVYAVSEDGQSMSGRWFEADHAEIGADWVAVRATEAQIVAVTPAAAKAGATTRVTVLGSGLTGSVNFGPGTRNKVVSKDAHALVIDLSVDSKAAPGYRELTIGKQHRADSLAVYDRVDRVDVTPAFGIARVGGGKIDGVAAQFEAVAYRDVADASGKTQPMRVGVLPVTWSVQPFNEDAKVADDVKFAGRLNADGRFLPAGAGPNPQRKFSANNAGNLSVLATLDDGGKPITGKAHLIVTVQRWNTPPIY